jgi:hypothetical protein
MSPPYLHIRAGQEHPDHLTSYDLAAANERCSTLLMFRARREDLKRFAEELTAFSADEDVEYEHAENTDKWAYYLLLRGFRNSRLGRCAFEVQTSKLGEPPTAYRCQFSIVAEPVALQELGRQLLALAQGAATEVLWKPGA